MFKIDFSAPSNIYFVGIGGISMSGLAEILADAGFHVSGSDRAPSAITEGLEAKGIRVLYGQKEENITTDIDCVVFTSAIREDNPEWIATHKLQIPSLSRAQLLGQLMKNYAAPIAISGTHGKTTTTSMISEILLDAQTNPTLSIGGILPSIGSNVRVGGPDYFVLEACEYTNSFLSFFPKIAVILNIEEDHLDFFKDLADIRNSFHAFAGLLPADGLLVISADIPNYREITEGISCPYVTFGASRTDAYGDPVDYFPSDVVFDDLGHAQFTANPSGRAASHSPVSLHLSVPGDHNVTNSLAALAVSDHLGLAREVVVSSINKYTGADRRFEHKGKVNGVTIIDDYAHHPTEIAATLKAARNSKFGRLWVVFQPHTYTRTKAFLHEFAEALSLADHVVLADIYAARETDTLGVSSRTLQEEIKALGKPCDYFPSFAEIEKFLLENCIEDDLLITMGAGDVVKIGENLLK